MITIVIPSTLQRPVAEMSIASVVASAQQLPGAEVLVIASGPGAAHPNVRVDSPLVSVLPCERASAAAARNVGLHFARHSIVLFTDDDCIVPLSWCTDLVSGLQKSDSVAVSGPVRVDVQGPITAFLNYQRIFDAPPMDGKNTRYLVTANCGIRRDVLQTHVRFDDANFTVGGEDAEFGYAIRDLGFNIAWLSRTDPVRHILHESIDEVTERFVAYGRASACLFNRRHRVLESVPDAVEWFRSILEGRYIEYRRFGELEDARARRAFSNYELMLSSAWLIGYLDELSISLSCNLISPNYEALRVGWHDIAAQIPAVSQDSGDIWSSLPVRISQWPFQLTESAVGQPSPQIAHNLQRNVPLGPPISPDIQAVLTAGRSHCDLVQERQRALLHELVKTRWKDVAESREALERILRELGISYSDGCHGIEQRLWSIIESRATSNNRLPGKLAGGC